MVIKGEKLPKVVTVLKVKKDVPTKIEMDGREYALIHKNQYGGKRK